LLSSVVSFFPLINFSTVRMSLCIPGRCRMSEGRAHIFTPGFNNEIPN
jgi:hypothetical protein